MDYISVYFILFSLSNWHGPGLLSGYSGETGDGGPIPTSGPVPWFSRDL